MGQVNFTPTQRFFLEELVKFKPLPELFYLSGGTALSVFYLHHRWSDDLDFFSDQKFGDETIDAFIQNISSLLGTKHRFTTIEQTKVFEFLKDEKLLLKVDFAYYPYPRLEEGKAYQGVSVDSLLDIAANKLLMISQRSEIKDFVDLYFLLEKFTVWDLMSAVEKKFKREIDLLLLGADFLKIEEFDFLPRMARSLKPRELQVFFKNKAREVAGRAVKG